MNERIEPSKVVKKTIEIEKGAVIDYKDLYGIKIIDAQPSGWIRFTLNGGYTCDIKLEPDTITKLIVLKGKRELLAYDRGDYDNVTDEGKNIEDQIREIFINE